MQVRFVALAAATIVLSGVIAVKSFAADEAPKMSAAEIAAGQAKAQTANTLIVLGRGERS